MSKLNQVDLNLLVALQALIRTKSVTKAALQLNVTQSAMSRTLQRLRDQFDDPMFVRAKGGLMPTERVSKLASDLDCLLQSAETLLSPAVFEPKQTTAGFTLMMTDFFAQVFMPSVFSSLFSQAPNIKINCLNTQPDLMSRLALGEADLGFSNMEQTAPADIYATSLGQDRLVTIMRKSHPLAQKVLTLDDYCSASHALITMGGDRMGSIDIALAKINRKRHVVLRLPHFTAAPHAIEKSDLLLTLPECLARNMEGSLDIVVMDPPLELDPYHYYMVWHARQHNNLAHRWLRQEIQRIISDTFQ